MKKNGYVLVQTLLICMFFMLASSSFISQSLEDHSEIYSYIKMKNVRSALKSSINIGVVYLNQCLEKNIKPVNSFFCEIGEYKVNTYLEFYDYNYPDAKDLQCVSIVAKACLNNNGLLEYKKGLIVKYKWVLKDSYNDIKTLGKQIFYKESSW